MSQLQRVLASIRKRRRFCVGVLSGTSADAAEAVVCDIRGTFSQTKLKVLSHVSLPFSRALAARILTAQSKEDVSQLNFELGHFFAHSVLLAISKARLKPQDIDVVGSHGQTLAHFPKGLRKIASTLQVGEASVISALTKIPTISDFRVADMAVGGQGAPLVPYADWVLFRKKKTFRGFLNIGGIANLSVVGDDLNSTQAFDTGPGNMLLDAIVRRMTNGKKTYDKNGLLAKEGQVIQPLLAEWMRLPYFRQRPPKSTGRELFGDSFLSSAWKRFGKQPKDVLATAAEFTIESIALAFEKWVLPHRDLEGIYVSGGGVRNPVLFEGLQERLRTIPVNSLNALDVPEETKEAVCFALLAHEWLSGVPQNIPSVTGARHPTVLGKLSL